MAACRIIYNYEQDLHLFRLREVFVVSIGRAQGTPSAPLSISMHV